MDFDRLSNDLKELRRRNRGLAMAVGALSAGHVIALVVILNLLRLGTHTDRPPSINKSFWVERDKASSDYPGQMGSFIAWLILDVTPVSIDWKKEVLLGYVEPDQHGALKTRQELEATRLKRINASTVFMPQQLVPSGRRRRRSWCAGGCGPLSTGRKPANDSKPIWSGSAMAGAACT